MFIFGNRTDNKWFIEIPRKIRDFCRMSTMNKLEDLRKFRRKMRESFLTNNSGGPSSASVGVWE